MELYNQRSFEQIELGHLEFVQDNLSFSQKGTLRGLHFQIPPHAQGKLVTVLEGEVLDVAVDIRKDSPTYGMHEAIKLSTEDPTLLYIPPGMAHGFQVLSDTCLFLYKCTSFYHKESERGIAWNDPQLEIPWENISPVLSEKDQQHPLFRDYDSPFQYTKEVMYR